MFNCFLCIAFVLWFFSPFIAAFSGLIEHFLCFLYIFSLVYQLYISCFVLFCFSVCPGVYNSAYWTNLCLLQITLPHLLWCSFLITGLNKLSFVRLIKNIKIFILPYPVLSFSFCRSLFLSYIIVFPHWRTSFNNFSPTGMLIMNSLIFRFSDKVIIISER